MNISELAQRTGVSVHRLRRYEAAGLIRAERSASGYRQFADSTLREVVFIAMGRARAVARPVRPAAGCRRGSAAADRPAPAVARRA
ncbi:MAG: MerR family DNA-binding transcriptional regulator, partial [Comamonadaceae bacterium]